MNENGFAEAEEEAEAEVAAIMGIHKSRVQQLERMALWKIRRSVRETGL